MGNSNCNIIPFNLIIKSENERKMVRPIKENEALLKNCENILFLGKHFEGNHIEDCKNIALLGNSFTYNTMSECEDLSLESHSNIIYVSDKMTWWQRVKLALLVFKISKNNNWMTPTEKKPNDFIHENVTTI